MKFIEALKWILALAIIALAVDDVRLRLGERDHFRELEAANDSIALLHEARASREAIWSDSLSTARSIADSLRDARQRVVVRTVEVERRRDDAAENLAIYLERDTTGLELLARLQGANEERLAIQSDQTALAIAEADTLRRSLVFAHSIIASQDSTIAEFRIQNGLLMKEARELYRKANPPFWKKAAYTAGAIVIGYGLRTAQRSFQ